MKSLLAQCKLTISQHIINENTYFSFSENVLISNAKLLANIRLMSIDEKSSLFFKEINNAALFTEQLLHQSFFSTNELEIILPIILNKYSHKPQDIVNLMLCHKDLQHLALSIALQNQYQVQLPHTCSNHVLQHHFINLFVMGRHRELMHYQQVNHNTESSESQLYLQILMKGSLTPRAVLNQILHHDLLSKDIFKIFILSLDEIQLTHLVNDLSTDDENYSLMISVMGLSSFSKFVPFLAEALFNADNAEYAFDYLKLMLGDKLSEFIPLAMQFDSNAQQRIQSFHYYGAKVLHLWTLRDKSHFSDHMLSGMPVNQENLRQIYKSHSLRHQKHAALMLLTMQFDAPFAHNITFRLIP